MTIPSHIAGALADLAATLREVPRAELEELWLERAAIREYEGRQERTEAERSAVEDCRAIYGGQRREFARTAFAADGKVTKQFGPYTLRVKP